MDTNQLYGVVNIALGATMLFIFGHAIMHLIMALAGLYFLFSGINMVRGSAPLSAQFMYWRSRFFR